MPDNLIVEIGKSIAFLDEYKKISGQPDIKSDDILDFFKEQIDFVYNEILEKFCIEPDNKPKFVVELAARKTREPNLGYGRTIYLNDNFIFKDINFAEFNTILNRTLLRLDAFSSLNSNINQARALISHELGHNLFYDATEIYQNNTLYLDFREFRNDEFSAQVSGKDLVLEFLNRLQEYTQNRHSEQHPSPSRRIIALKNGVYTDVVCSNINEIITQGQENFSTEKYFKSNINYIQKLAQEK